MLSLLLARFANTRIVFVRGSAGVKFVSLWYLISYVLIRQVPIKYQYLTLCGQLVNPSSILCTLDFHQICIYQCLGVCVCKSPKEKSFHFLSRHCSKHRVTTSNETGQYLTPKCSYTTICTATFLTSFYNGLWVSSKCSFCHCQKRKLYSVQVS